MPNILKGRGRAVPAQTHTLHRTRAWGGHRARGHGDAHRRTRCDARPACRFASIVPRNIIAAIEGIADVTRTSQIGRVWPGADLWRCSVRLWPLSVTC